MRFTSTALFIALAVLTSTACGADPTTITPEPAPVTHPPPDAGVDSGKHTDAAVATCPAQDPGSGSACSGELRCQLKRHGDCNAPSCPSGCKYLGIDPNAKVTSGVVYFASCQDGHWAQSTQGDCSANDAAALCDCPDRDAGQ